MTTPTPTNPIERLDVPLDTVLAELARIRESLPLDDPDRHALDLDADTRFAQLAANWSTT
ncbi:hypothetical protein GCM10011583_18590 [Streptomyces camponoticapitis]|uniref:Uncharacterized protein n=1 Tax=Streptomyces camponoticapitis TaxID=1616125 RepID=A0ABQ2E2N4_9ACTN|nr:hypothetical protein [Streptomyces camponoticapitis]GGJ87331.1 hypothetical protein GCM10011583_18590 [Streptomyces camponoticapitis]